MRIYIIAGNRKRCEEMICSLEPEGYLHPVPNRMDGNERQKLFVFCRKHVLYKMMASSPGRDMDLLQIQCYR